MFLTKPRHAAGRVLVAFAMTAAALGATSVSASASTGLAVLA